MDDKQESLFSSCRPPHQAFFSRLVVAQNSYFGILAQAREGANTVLAGVLRGCGRQKCRRSRSAIIYLAAVMMTCNELAFILKELRHKQKARVTMYATLQLWLRGRADSRQGNAVSLRRSGGGGGGLLSMNLHRVLPLHILCLHF
eukprot:1160239-Pelagomonas_calceolata.AAC.4